MPVVGFETLKKTCFLPFLMKKENLFARSSRDHSIFQSEKFLYPEFLPERLPHRDSQIDEMVYCLQPLTQGLKGENVLVLGKTGTGKTVAVRFVLAQLEEFSDRSKYLYINCFEYYSRHAILSHLCQFMGYALPRRGLSTDEVFTQLLEAFKKSSFTPLIVLDEFDQLLIKGESDVLYDLLRVANYHVKVPGLILISNDHEIAHKLDDRIRSSLHPHSIVFESYNPTQLKDILRDRCQYAFTPNSIDPDVINVAAAHASKLGGDCRIALESLLKAGRLAEKENAPKVTLDHLQRSFETILVGQGRKKFNRLTEDETLLIKALLPHPRGLDSGDWFISYGALGGKIQERMFRQKINEFEKNGIISFKEEVKGKGKTRRCQLLLDRDQLDSILNQK